MGIESYVVVHNIAKRHDVGTLARSATAFGVAELILVGRHDFNSFGGHDSTSISWFPSNKGYSFAVSPDMVRLLLASRRPPQARDPINRVIDLAVLRDKFELRL